MKRTILTLVTGLLVAGAVGSAVAAVPDASPLSWPSAAVVELPDVPEPPTRKVVTPTPAEIRLVIQPRVSPPCADRDEKRARLRASKESRSRTTA